jgi:hypothetical protein
MEVLSRPILEMSASFELTITVVCLLANLFAIARLWQLKLIHSYPILFVWLCGALPNGFAFIFWGPKDRHYFYTYVPSELVLLVLHVLVVWELFSVIFQQYKGLRSLSRWVMGIAAAISASISLGILAVTATGQRFITKRGVLYLSNAERSEASALVLFILILLFFISRYPIKLPRNNVVHSAIFSIYFLSDAAGLLLFSSLSARGAHLANSFMTCIQAGCYLAWGLLLSREGERTVTKVRQNLSPERERILIRELDALNETLLRASRSISTKPSAKV